ncbi:hypothetical protein [Elioraea rosea]|uniref:hypothetical protein n=1 Tax=Elioraea rosea TaxID=2492390 RepID=UPI001184CF5F|nr:hypothetical protein [Elioraea rosea]
MHSIGPAKAVPPIQKGMAETAQHAASPAQAEASPAAVQPKANPTSPIVNPALRYDLRLGLVVVEFFDEVGEVAHSIPTPRQLKAYESGLNVRSGPVPLPRDLPAGTDEDGLAVVA